MNTAGTCMDELRTVIERSGRDVRPTKQKSVSDSHFQLKGTGNSSL